MVKSKVRGDKRKKHHDKDKYYNLAKEQGFRSRAAFKLSQINRNFPFLQEATMVLDLCAAPGGWTQVAARTMPKGHIIAVDILPIRPFPGQQNRITTIVGDITTSKCKADITSAVKRTAGGAPKADLVLHDGAPNIGASYERDAYVQNEIAVHALRCATQHLRPKGHFVTKLYRSRDYASYLWVAQQLFRNVTAFKPKASRIQSAEIFLVCESYLAPDKIDPRILDPKHIFEQVEGESTGAGTESSKALHVFHKQWDQKKRHREGYDMTYLDATMRRIRPITDFIRAKGMKEAIQVLSDCTGLAFRCRDEGEEEEDEEEKQKREDSQRDCRFLLEHPLTTPEIKTCVSDLKVLGRSDFKDLLSWRTKMEEALAARDEDEKSENDDDDDSQEEEASSSDDEEPKRSNDNDEDEEEARIQEEIAEVKRKRIRERKRAKKKERAQATKRRARAALGMDVNAIDVPEHDKTFSLATISSKGELEAAAEVNLDQITDDQIFGGDSSEDDDDSVLKWKGDEKDDKTGYSYRLDQELDQAYDRYMQGTKSFSAKSGSKMEKRAKKSRKLLALEEAEEDQELLRNVEQSVSSDAKAYAKLLMAQGESDGEEESSSEEDEDGFHDEPMTPEEHAKKTARKNKEQRVEEPDRNPLIHKLADETAAAKTARWFSNPLFASIGQTAEVAASSSSGKPVGMGGVGGGDDQVVEEDSSDEAGGDLSSDEDSSAVEDKDKKKETAGEGSVPKTKKSKKKVGMNADDVLAMIPKTDKQLRHERRLKAMEREERRQRKKAKKLGEAEKGFEIAPAVSEDEGEAVEEALESLTPQRRAKILEARRLIKAGMGTDLGEGATNNTKGIEIVPEEENDVRRPLPVLDTRRYDSENEDYDSDDYAQTLALGTMMLRKSKAKALVDASYNRYAWNDPEDLPDWFVDDENKHYRPQLPIPPALVAKIKAEQMALSVRPIAKVAEARARKNKRAKTKLAAAKKKAEALANSTEMSEAMKLKAISKTLRQQDNKQKPGKTYVVSKKGQDKRGVKGVKLVDKRMKNDKRAMDRKDKKRKKGKQNGLVGSKRRRHHK